MPKQPEESVSARVGFPSLSSPPASEGVYKVRRLLSEFPILQVVSVYILNESRFFSQEESLDSLAPLG